MFNYENFIQLLCNHDMREKIKPQFAVLAFWPKYRNRGNDDIIDHWPVKHMITSLGFIEI